MMQLTPLQLETIRAELIERPNERIKWLLDQFSLLDKDNADLRRDAEHHLKVIANCTAAISDMRDKLKRIEMIASVGELLEEVKELTKARG